jgi:hypothetical protein
MTRTKLGLLGLCAMVLGLMAFSATGAQAAGTWLILNAAKEVKTGVELPAVLELEKDKNKEGIEHYILHTEILKIKVLFLCSGIKAVNAKIFGEGAIGKGPGEEKESRVLFSGCETFFNGVAEPKCKPLDKTDGSGFIVTELLHALAELHKLEVGGALDDIVKILPDVEGEPFARIALPAGCVIGTSVPVFGKLALLDCENMALTHLAKHLVEPFLPLTRLWVISDTPEHAATLLGSAWAKLGGVHEGLAWSISGL